MNVKTQYPLGLCAPRCLRRKAHFRGTPRLASLIPRLLARPGQDAGSEGSRSPARVRRARPGGRETTWRSRHSLVGSRTRRAAPSSLLRLLADGRAAWGEAGRWGWPLGALRASACMAGRRHVWPGGWGALGRGRWRRRGVSGARVPAAIPGRSAEASGRREAEQRDAGGGDAAGFGKAPS